MLLALGHHEHLPRRQLDSAIPKLDAQHPLQHEEGLICIGMAMPDKIALQPHNLELVIVHFGDNFGLPLL